MTASSTRKLTLSGCVPDTKLYSVICLTKVNIVQGWFESLRMESFSSNIDVCMICPGNVHSNIDTYAFTGDPESVSTSSFIIFKLLPMMFNVVAKHKLCKIIKQ